MKVKLINGLIAFCALGIFITSYINEIGIKQIVFCVGSGIVFAIFFISLFQKTSKKNIANHILTSKITELALLNDNQQSIAFWEMYGKVSLVLGLDIGENKVDVSLLNSTYSSTIDVEHAVLNYSGDKWYIEDLGSQNGTSIIKSDGKKYKITTNKPCLLEKDDIICISLTKLKLC